MNDTDRDFLANQKLEEGLKIYYAKDYNRAIKLSFEIKSEFLSGIQQSWQHLQRFKTIRAGDSTQSELCVGVQQSRACLSKVKKCYQALGDEEKAQADFAKAKELGYKG